MQNYKSLAHWKQNMRVKTSMSNSRLLHSTVIFLVELLGVVEKDLPRKTVSLVVALVSPTPLEATHSYMASSRGVRKG